MAGLALATALEQVRGDYVKALALINELAKENALLKAQLEHLEKVPGHESFWSWQTIINLKKERDQAQAACAQLHNMLREFADASADQDTSAYAAHLLLISTDCGNGYVNVEKLKPTIELLFEVSQRLGADYITINVNEEWKRLKKLVAASQAESGC